MLEAFLWWPLRWYGTYERRFEEEEASEEEAAAASSTAILQAVSESDLKAQSSLITRLDDHVQRCSVLKKHQKYRFAVSPIVAPYLFAVPCDRTKPYSAVVAGCVRRE